MHVHFPGEHLDGITLHRTKPSLPAQMNEIEAFHQQLQLQMDRELQFAKERGLLSTPTPPGAASFHEEESFRSARPDEFTSYYRYESIVIYGGRTVPCIAAPPSAEAATGGSWAALVVVAAAASAAVGAVLARRFESMCYREESKAQIVLLWPLLALFSPKFRAQLRRVFKREGLGEEGDRRRGDTRSAEMLSAPDPDSTKSQRQP